MRSGGLLSSPSREYWRGIRSPSRKAELKIFIISMRLTVLSAPGYIYPHLPNDKLRLARCGSGVTTDQMAG